MKENMDCGVKTHVLLGTARADGTPTFLPMHIKDARKWLQDNGLDGDLCDHLPINAMRVKGGRLRGYAYAIDIYIIPITRSMYTAAKYDGFVPDMPRCIIEN